ncbi:MAG TPA: hypothetical protein DDW52_17965 [Planctomycetaceae bacterium]|nr:hypothetical protein [Planctomycetaceae bacterium]
MPPTVSQNACDPQETMIVSTTLATVYRVLGILGISTLILSNAIASDRSYVLLQSASKSETVQSGIVTEDPRGYTIELTPDSKAWVPRNRVQFIGKSLQEVYAFRCQRISYWSSGDHLEMARWCIRHDLVDEASRHYLEIPTRYQDRPQIRQVGQQIKSKLLADNGFRQYLGLPQETAVAAPSGRSFAAAASANQAQGTVVTASATSPSISQEAKTRFFSRVQPILQNRCSQAACHGFRSSNDLRLLEPYGQAFARISTANLESTAKHVGPAPADSRELVDPGKHAESSNTPALVHYATTAHAKQRTPAIQPDETVLVQELLDWCKVASGQVVTAEGTAALQAAVQPAHLNATSTDQSNSNVSSHGVTPRGLQQVGPGGSQLRAVPESVNGSLETNASMLSEIDALEAELERILNAKSSPRSSDSVPAGHKSSSTPTGSTGIQGHVPSSLKTNPADPFDASVFNNQPKR